MSAIRFRRHSGLVATLVAGLAAAPASGAAQPVQDELAGDFERLRGNVLQYVQAMPDSALGFAPTDEVRTFAEQIEHVCVGNVAIVASSLGVPREERPDLGDPERYLADKDALRGHVDASFDWIVSTVRALGDAELAEPTVLFGEAEVSREKAVRTAYEHGVWTLGEIIPYLRLNGITPPAYALTPGGG